MSTLARAQYPRSRVSASHFYLSLARGEKKRSLALRPGALYALLAIVPLLCLWYLAATLYLIFRDDMLAAMMQRQAEMQYAYEDRLAAMRGHLDRVSSRQLLDQDSFEGKVHELLSRQAQLEARGNVVTALAAHAGVARDVTGAIGKQAPDSSAARAAARAMPAPGAGKTGGSTASPSMSSYAPLVPVEDGAEVHGEASDTLPVAARLASLASSLDVIDTTQVAAVFAIEFQARDTAQRLRTVIADTGLSLDQLTPPTAKTGQGGPFVPLKVDANGSAFEKAVAHLQGALASADKVERLLPFLPLRRPLPAGAETSSPFGARNDPFLGRPAMHTGQDFRFEYGAAVHATAAGKVMSAGRNGGYGNMVEIDHGNGLTTRYAHLAAVDVEVDQAVAAGDVVGKLGSTGRSTGPHLHYETRIDGEAVDPQRFLRPGARIFSGL